MAQPKEPQSYGSEKDWVTGNTGQEVNRQKGHPNSQHSDFYSSRRESEGSAPDQGGNVSPVQAAENVEPEGPATDERVPVQGVTGATGGTKTGGYFKKRDYE